VPNPTVVGETCGAIAQLGERYNGIVEVVGSIPSGSTNNFKDLADIFAEPFLFTPPYPHKHIN
jgi:hypothetical protein